MRVGAHVSASGSLALSFPRAQEISAQCTQIFISPPQQWQQTPHSVNEVNQYKSLQQATNIYPNFIHGAYLINLASPNPVIVTKSVNWLIYSQNMAEKLAMAGTIFHVGSSKGEDHQKALDQVIVNIRQILAKSGRAQLILENSAGAGNLIGGDFPDLGYILKAVGDPRIKICLDTQHAFAMGHNLATKEGLETLITEIDREVGLKNLVAIHVNDSKTELGSKRDRHENIGEGFIGIEGFKNIVRHPALKDIALILEVPGSGQGPDTSNLSRLRDLIVTP